MTEPFIITVDGACKDKPRGEVTDSERGHLLPFVCLRHQMVLLKMRQQSYTRRP
jgi:hypothetical protein